MNQPIQKENFDTNFRRIVMTSIPWTKNSHHNFLPFTTPENHFSYLEKIIKHYIYHLQNPLSEEEKRLIMIIPKFEQAKDICDWDKKFIEDFNTEELYTLTNIAHTIKYENLSDLCCKAHVNIVRERLKNFDPSAKNEMIAFAKEKLGPSKPVPKCISEVPPNIANVRKLWGIGLEKLMDFSDQCWERTVRDVRKI